MKALIFIFTIVVCSCVCAQKSGIYKAVDSTSKGKAFLSIKLLSDSIVVFVFTDDKNNLSFNSLPDFGICKLVNNKWVGKIDESFMDRDYGDFVTGKKRGRYVNFELNFSTNCVNVILVNNSQRTFIAGKYKFFNRATPKLTIHENYKNVGYAKLLYKPITKIQLCLLPECLIKSPNFIGKGEIVDIENEYETYVFVVKYTKSMKVALYGWVNRASLQFLKKEEM